MIQDKWFEAKEKIADLTLRERAILAGTTVVLVVFVWLQFVFTDIEKTQKKLAQQKSEMILGSVTQSERLVELTTLLAHDPNAALREERAVLDEELRELRMHIENRLSHLIAPEKMADVMRRVLSDYKGLELLSARNLPVEPLKIHSDEENKQGLEFSSNQAESEAVIFAHGFMLELSGTYFQTVEFLQHLEKMSGFYWQALDYEVDDYPKAKIKLQLNTLSLEEDWIGV